MSEQELTDLEGMDWDIDGGHWYSVANGDVSPDRLLAYTIWLRDERAALKREIAFMKDTLEDVQKYFGKMDYPPMSLQFKVTALLAAEEQE